MIGEALELDHQGTQPSRARRRIGRQRRFNGLRERNGIGDGAVAGNAARQPCRARDLRAESPNAYLLSMQRCALPE